MLLLLLWLSLATHDDDVIGLALASCSVYGILIFLLLMMMMPPMALLMMLLMVLRSMVVLLFPWPMHHDLLVLLRTIMSLLDHAHPGAQHLGAPLHLGLDGALALDGHLLEWAAAHELVAGQNAFGHGTGPCS